MEQREYLHTLYQLQDRLVYTSVSTMLAEPEHSIDSWHIYISSKHLGGSEVVYGSLLHIMDEAVRPIFRASRLLEELMNILPDEVQSSAEKTVTDRGSLVTLPPGTHTDQLLHRQEEILKDALLLSALHVRTLLEDFSGVGNIPITIYDYDGEPAGEVLLSRVFHTLAHYRYCMVSGEFVHDIFSKEGTLGSNQLVGSKMRISDIFDAVFEFISRIKVRSFVGVLRGRLHGLSSSSESSDVIFAVQNLASIWQIIRDRTTAESQAPAFLSFLQERLAKQKLEAEAPKWAKQAVITLMWTHIGFRIGDDLGKKIIETKFIVGEKSEKLELTWDKFFTGLVEAHGEEPLVSHAVLVRRFESLDGSRASE